jgi:hypothetical protein
MHRPHLQLRLGLRQFCLDAVPLRDRVRARALCQVALRLQLLQLIRQVAQPLIGG